MINHPRFILHCHMKPIYYAYLVITVGICAALHIAKIGSALPTLTVEFDLSATQAGFFISLVQFAGMLFGLLIGALVESFGRRKSLLTGLLLLTTCNFIELFSHSVNVMLILRGIEGLGFLLIAMPAPAMIRQFVTPKEFSTVMGWWGAYMPIGMAISLFFCTLAIHYFNWRLWWGVLSTLTLILLLLTFKVLPKDTKNTEEKLTLNLPSSNTKVFLKSLRSRVMLTLKSTGPWLVAIGFAMYSAQWLTIIGFLPTIYTQAGITGVAAGLMTALIAAANIVGNVYAGRLISRHIFAPYILYFGFIVMGICAFIAFATLQWEATWLIWARFGALFLFSAAGGLIPSTLFYLAVEFAPNQETVSTTIGWTQQFSSTGQFLAPPLVGALADINHGNWQWTWVILCSCCICGLILAKISANYLRRRA